MYPDNNVSNGGKRDIPDYSEMFPELVWDYYLATGDRATLAAAYPTMRNVAQYVSDSTSAAGQAAGLVCQLASFSPSTAYKFGIIDWPPARPVQHGRPELGRRHRGQHARGRGLPRAGRRGPGRSATPAAASRRHGSR